MLFCLFLSIIVFMSSPALGRNGSLVGLARFAIAAGSTSYNRHPRYCFNLETNRRSALFPHFLSYVIPPLFPILFDCACLLLFASDQAVGAYKSEFVSAAVLGDCDSYPGDLDGFSSPSPSPDSSESDDATPAPEEQTTTSQAGVNFALSRESSVDEIYNVETNEAGGSSGLGECATVLEVEKVKVEHAEDADDTTSVDNLFDSDMKSYFSVNRESTTLTFELKEETDVNGISIGFFMKLAAEKRIQTFDIAVRGADDEDWTTVISRKESSGSMEDVQHFPFPSYTVLYVRFESHGNTFNK